MWQATKQAKTVTEKLAETIEALKKFSDAIVETDAEAFATVLATLATITIKPEPETVEEVPAETPAE